jgi:hypothetical protein
MTTPTKGAAIAALLADFDFVVGWDDFVFLELIIEAYSRRQIQSIRFNG